MEAPHCTDVDPLSTCLVRSADSRTSVGVWSTPSEAEKAFIHDSIYDELVQNRFRDETRQEYQRIISALGELGADCVALACTEIPLLLRPEDSPLPAFSTTELHCEAAVAVALGDTALSAYHQSVT